MVTGTRKGLEIYYEVTDNRTKSILACLVLKC